MQELTKNAILNLQRTTGHVLAVKDFEDIEALDGLAEKMNGVSSVERRLLNSPFELCGIKFYPLTVAKSLWFTEKCEEWDIPAEHQDAFMFWVLSFPLTEEPFDKYTTHKKADGVMRKFARRMHMTHDEINSICSRCLGVVDSCDEDGSKDSSTAFGGMVACLIREFGQSPDYWLFEASVEKVMEFYTQIIARVTAEEDSNRQASSGKGKATAPRATPKLKAFKAFRDKAKLIEDKWSSDNGE